MLSRDVQVTLAPAPSNRELLALVRDLQERVLILEGDKVAANRVGPHVRGSATSRQAALNNYPRSGSQRYRILEFLESRGHFGATRQEIASELGLSDDSVRPRVVELIEGRWVRANGLTRPTPMGEQAEVLVAADRELRIEQLRQDVSPSPVVSEAPGVPGMEPLGHATVGDTTPGASETTTTQSAIYGWDE